MADFGSIAILVKLVGGADVLKQLNEIRNTAKQLESKPIQIRVNTGSDSIDASRKKTVEYVAWWERQLDKQEKDDIRRERRVIEESNRLHHHKTKLAQQTIQQIENESKAQEILAQKQLTTQQRIEQARSKASVAGQRDFQQWLSGQQKAANDYAAFWENAIRKREQAQRRVEGFRQSQQYSAQQTTALQTGNLGALGIAGSNAYLQGLNNIFGSSAAAQQEASIERVRRLGTILGTTSVALNRFSGMWDRSLQGIARFSDGLTHAGQVAATFAYRLTLITAPIDLLIAKSLQFTVGLEYSLAKVGTQLDGTLEQIQSFLAQSKALTLDLQVKYGVSPQQQSDALYYLVSSGVSQDQALAALDPLAKLSAVTQTSPGVASQALVATMNVFADELARFPDLTDRATYALEVMFDATRKGRFEFTDFATQFGRAAEQMHMANATFEETAAMLAVLSQVFTPSQASTTLNSFAKAFLNPIEKAKAAFESLKVDLYEMVGGKNVRRSFAGVFAETFDELGRVASTDEQRANELMGDLFGDLRGGRGAQMLVDPRNRQLLQEILSEILAGTDNIGQAWELMAGQIQVSINQTIGMFYKLGDAVIKNLEPTIRGALAGIQVFFKGLTDNPQVAQVLANVGAVLAIAAPAALVFATALMGAGGLLTAIATLMTPAYLIGFSLLVQRLAPSLTAAASASSAFGGGLNGILATVTETARQLGLLSDKDALNIFKQLGVDADLLATSKVGEFVSELRKLGDDAAKIGNSIKTIAEGVGLLIDNISKGKGILGFFGGIVKGVAGLAEGSVNFSGSGGIATALDAVIGGMVVAKLGGMLAGALKFITTNIMHVNAGAVNIAGLNPLSQTPFVGADGKPVAGGGAGGILGAGAGGLLIATIAATVSQKFFDDIKGNSLATAVFRGGDFGNPFTSAIAGLVNEAAKAITGQGFIDKIFGQASQGAAASTVSSSPIATKSQQVEAARLFGNSSQLPAASIVSSFNGAINAVRAFASAATSAANRLAGITGMITAGQGYFAPPTLSADPNARYRALDARYQAMYPNEMASAEQVFGDKMQVADTRRAAAQRAEDALKKFADAAEDAAKRLADAVRGLVSEALGATSVTEKDQERMDLQKELSKLNSRLANDNLGRQQQRIVESRIGEISVRLEQLGAYKDQPDEFARRTRAVATDTDPSIYGQAYQEQLALAQSKMPGESLEDLASAFCDKSLFAKMTPAEIDQMWNWDAVVDSVRRGIDRIVGEWKLMKQAVGEVMSQLTGDEIASLKEALGLGADTSLDSLASKFLGKTTGLGTEGQAIGGTIDEETMGTFGGFADILERIKDNADIVIKMSFDEKMWEKAQEAINAAEEYIRDHLAKYADIFIQITARFSEESGGGGGEKPPTEGESGSAGARATGGYVTQGIYKVGEQGYEYVLPHPLTKWIETMMGGKINSPNDIMWLIQALTSAGGKNEALAKSADWAATQNGGYYEMPKNFAKWIDRIKVIVDDQKISLDDALWQMGNPSVTTNARGGGGAGGGGTGTDGSGDLSALKGSLDTLISALNRLTRSIDAMSRAGFQTPQPVSDFVGSTGRSSNGGDSNSETIIFNGDIIAPNQATIKTLTDSIMNQTRRRTSARANLGMA